MRGAADDAVQASALLSEAATLAERIGMPALLARARALGARTDRAGVPPDDLSWREVDILRLVAAGQSNREIGARALHQRAHRRQPRPQHPAQNRRCEPHRGCRLRLPPRTGRHDRRAVGSPACPSYLIERTFAEQLDMTQRRRQAARGDQRRRGRQLALLLPQRRPAPLLLPLRGAEPRRDHRRRQTRGDPSGRGNRSQPRHRRLLPLTHSAECSSPRGDHPNGTTATRKFPAARQPATTGPGSHTRFSWRTGRRKRSTLVANPANNHTVIEDAVIKSPVDAEICATCKDEWHARRTIPRVLLCATGSRRRADESRGRGALSMVSLPASG